MRKVLLLVLLAPLMTTAQNVVTNPATSQTITQPAGTTLNTNSFEQIRYADQYLGSDIFAKANAAAASLNGGAGEVVIPPGAYSSVTSTLNCLNNVVFVGKGVTIGYSGSGTAVYCANVENAGVEGFNITGPGTSGSTIGLQVGVGSGGSGVVTLYNELRNIHISSFYTGVKIDGYPANGTYTNTFSNVTVYGSFIGWDLRPNNAGYAAGNTFVGCDVENSVNDGLVIDGSNGNWFFGFRAENNGHFGVNLSGNQLTNGNVWSGGWFENNTAGDMNFGSVNNVVRTRVYGPALVSATKVAGNPGGLLNEVLGGSGAYSNDYYSGPFQWHVTAASGNATYPWSLNNDENPSSGKTNIVALKRTGPNAGNVFLGTPEYPVVVNSNLSVNGTLTKSSGSFKIDHPLDPANKYLSHSFVESPDMMNIYNGVATLDQHGRAVVRLPEWFEALNRDFRYQLTCIGGYAPVYISSEIRGNEFKIAGGRSGIKVSWQVTGIRHDAYADAHRIPVEETKPFQERGHYLHPDLFEHVDGKDVGAATQAKNSASGDGQLR